MKWFSIKMLVTGWCLFASANLTAREYRLPYFNGFKVYDFEGKKGAGYRFDFKSTVYLRQAHRSFQKHGMSTKHLTALLFNDDEFRLSKIFENAYVLIDTQDYNPYMRVMKIAPRVHYSEHGLHLKGTVSKEVVPGKGRVGVRVAMPIRMIEMERKDIASRRDSQTEDVRKISKNDATGNTSGFAYRLDFLEALPQSPSGNSAVEYRTNGIKIFNGATGVVSGKMQAAAVVTTEGHAPKWNEVGVAAAPESTSTLPTTLTGLSQGVVYTFGSAASDFSALADSAASSVSARIANQDSKAAVWVVSTHNTTDGSLMSGASESINSSVNSWFDRFNSNAYEWLYDKGYVFESSKRMGLGDIDVDLYYEHQLSTHVGMEVFSGVRIPLASGKDYSGNPYCVQLGNGEHWEAKIGSRLLWLIGRRLHVSFDGTWSFVLEGKEWRCAVPEGSLVKNIGQRAELNASWNYFVGNIDFTLSHPKTNDVSVLFGYQFYHKSKDTVYFKQSSLESWLGKKYDSATKAYTTINNVALDNSLAAANTKQYAHRIKGCITYYVSDWASLDMGGSFTIAGQNCAKPFDLYGSFCLMF